MCNCFYNHILTSYLNSKLLEFKILRSTERGHGTRPLTLARACAAKGYCSRSVRRRSVGRSVCCHVFSRTVAAEDTKRGCVGTCNGRSAQQESGAS